MSELQVIFDIMIIILHFNNVARNLIYVSQLYSELDETHSSNILKLTHLHKPINILPSININNMWYNAYKVHHMLSYVVKIIPD